jgi:adenylosuccinate synthase
MPSVAIVGSQWGDEGKGKITDFLAEEADVVVRYQGGNNAGHTVVVGSDVFKLHLIPSGAIHPGTQCVLGNGVVIDPLVLVDELARLRERGVTEFTLHISERAHVIMPYHRVQDELEEALRGGEKIGTTGRGIGPAYVDKVARNGIRMIDLIDPDRFRRRLESILPLKNRLLNGIYGHAGFTVDEIIGTYRKAAEILRPLVEDTSVLVAEAIQQGKKVLFEGAQGTLLDIDHGTYPFVTSSSPTAGGIGPGVGVSPRTIERILGVAKAYTTRVGTGPFPTELHDATGDWIRERGNEYGTTTGRPRRCGWFDAVVVRYAARVNGLTDLALTNVDTLAGLDEVNVCVAYEYRGKRLQHLPASAEILQECRPIYERFSGWSEDLEGVTRWEELPEAARAYVEGIERLVGVPVSIVSIGRARSATLVRNPLFTRATTA